MINVRKSNERGHFDHGWLDTYHTFSFAGYEDPQHRQFRALRVINEDRVAPGQGFGTHPHRDMEIITYVLSGQLEHRDSMGTGSIIRAGDFQRMTAGSGIEHSEFNPSEVEPVHLLQIWIFPDRKGLTPEYEQRSSAEFAASDSSALRLAASPDGRAGSLTIHQDAQLWLAALGGGQSETYQLDPGRHAWVQVVRGELKLNDVALSAGDGAAVSDESALQLTANSESELLLFDLA